jgi:hypothetical protein
MLKAAIFILDYIASDGKIDSKKWERMGEDGICA